MSEINKEFEAIAAKINIKLKEAAAVLREVNQLATEAKLPGLIYTQFIRDEIQYEARRKGKTLTSDQIDERCEALEAKFELIDVSGLESELGEAGWSTSSSYC